MEPPEKCQQERNQKDGIGIVPGESGRAKTPGEVAQENEEQEGVDCVEQHIHEVKAPGEHTPKGNIGHVGYPQEGNIHRCRTGLAKCLSETGEGKAVGDHRVLGDERHVVKFDEAIADGGKEEEESCQEDKKATESIAQARRCREDSHG